jgi:hypothetical protein
MLRKTPMAMTNMQSTSWADNKELIFRLWSAYNQEHEPGYTMSSLHDHFCMFEYAPGLGFTPEQIRNAIECWRVRLSEAVYTAAEKAAERYAASNQYNPSNP